MSKINYLQLLERQASWHDKDYTMKDIAELYLSRQITLKTGSRFFLLVFGRDFINYLKAEYGKRGN